MTDENAKESATWDLTAETKKSGTERAKKKVRSEREKKIFSGGSEREREKRDEWLFELCSQVGLAFNFAKSGAEKGQK